MMVQFKIDCPKMGRSTGMDCIIHDQDVGWIADGTIFVYIMGYETE